MVRPTSRMCRAISFGVFWRVAPSTSAIMRSRKDSPGFGGDAHDDAIGEHLGAAGDRGAVAAALADDRRRLAGDRRLVDRGDAFDDLAVAGDQLAGLDDDHVALAQRRRRNRFLAAVRRAGAPWSPCASCAASSACALPRPSATASAKLANSTVNHSQRLHGRGEPGGAASGGGAMTGRGASSSVVSTLPTSTTNITGFLATCCGRELAQAVRSQRRDAQRSRGSKSDELA